MREWLMVLAPVALVTYFVAFPDEFNWAINWLRGIF